MKNAGNIVEVFTEINDLFNFEKSQVIKPCSNIKETKLQPYLQGNIDNLCGLYALINATRLVIYPSKVKPELLSRCVSVLTQKKKAGDFIGKGTYSTDINYLLKAVFIDEYPIRFTKPFIKAVDLDVYWSKLKKFLEEENRAVIILFSTEHNGHWTVVRDITDNELILFDSKRTKNLTKDLCTTTELSKIKTRLLVCTMTYCIKSLKTQ